MSERQETDEEPMNDGGWTMKAKTNQHTEYQTPHSSSITHRSSSILHRPSVIR
jgi:hypothetical protein